MTCRSGFINILDFGAVSDGTELCTKAFSSAVDKCVETGGGTVYVPAGTFLTGPIQLKSNTALYLEAGSRILFSSRKEDYPLVEVRWEGFERPGYMPMLYARAAENISVTGTGTLDGQGEFWWDSHQEGTLEYPRPRLIYFEDCTRILIEKVQLINSPAWTVNPVRCQNITIDNISIINPPSSPNTDGINPDSCKNVRISNCQVDVGDDCITIKSGIEKSKHRIPCENVCVTNCTLLHGHGGVVIGSEMSGGVRNVVISNCIFEGTDRGIRLKTRRGRGGSVCDIRINNLIMKDVMCPIVMHQYYFCGEGGKDQKVRDKAEYPVTDETPCFREIHFSNITAVNANAAAAFLYGLPEMPIENITFDNVSISMAENAVPGVPAMMEGVVPTIKMGVFCCNVGSARFSNVSIKGHKGPAFNLKSCKNINFSPYSPGKPDLVQEDCR
ncbi:MAG: pgl [Eubacterium sp.]|nr:pgl [Eubacterium sp.]